ncbi:MAG: thioesterase [Methylococcales bacterium]|nr:thioesterase [Methylococcales bacterium]
MLKTPWLTYFQQVPGAKLSLVCFPYAGGGGHIFAQWKENLPSNINIIAVNPPGRGARMMETPFSQMSPLIADLLPAIKALMNTPVIFFGHSLGAVTAFEVARALRKQNVPLPKKLLAAGRRAPQVENDSGAIYHLPDAEFTEEIRKKKGTPEEVLNNDELMALVLPMLKADFEIADTHQYQDEAPFDFPISYFWGKEDKPVNRNNDDAWAQQTHAEYQHHELNGGHFFLHSEKEQLLSLITKELQSFL